MLLLTFTLIAFYTLPLATVMAAPQTDPPAGGSLGTNPCPTGELQCCQSTEDPGATSPATNTLAGLLGIVLGDITGQVGVNCSPISAVGIASGSNCPAEPVCCSNTTSNGELAMGCAPLNVNL
ncbi:fungal hydrophobin-domain-containing protein [Infundibulicybe gibba]|nr:fungal hydrophobin-domain-containing protein [Infundibulicybe gibba]